MDSDVEKDKMGEHSRNVDQIATPAMPQVRDTVYREPTAVHYYTRHSIGWQDTRKEGRCFIVVKLGGMGSLKVVDRFPLNEDGWVTAWAALVKLDAKAAQTIQGILEKRAANVATQLAERERRQQVYKAIVRSGNSHSVFRALRVQVLAETGEVYTFGAHDPASKMNDSRPLGPLSGAEAMVTDGSQAWSPGRAMLLPIALTGLATKTKAHAAIVFADGTVHTTELNGNSALREAQVQVVKFNALACTSDQQAKETASDPAARLRQLKDLLDEGLITQEEYTAKRMTVVDSI